jgi:RimJ/RimL family protein N-acetyltransferase
MYLGKKVRLRAFEREDAERYRNYVNDGEVASLVDRAKPATALEHARWYESLVSSDKVAAFAIDKHPRGGFIGLVWLFAIDWRHRRAEVRIVIGERTAWGGGYGTDALKTLVRAAFGPLNLEKLFAEVLATNTRAIKAFEAAGFFREGLLRGDRVMDGRRSDFMRLGLLRPDPARSKKS